MDEYPQARVAPDFDAFRDGFLRKGTPKRVHNP
jgi:hypothetical protein